MTSSPGTSSPVWVMVDDLIDDLVDAVIDQPQGQDFLDLIADVEAKVEAIKSGATQVVTPATLDATAVMQ